MSKRKAIGSYSDSPESALTTWWGTNANKIKDPSDTEMFITTSAMSNLSDIMSNSEDSLFPMPFQAVFRSGFGEKGMDAQLETMFARRGLQLPTRECMGRHSSRPLRSTVVAYTSCEVFEWIWDVVASYIDAKLLSGLPLTSNRDSRKTGISNRQRQAEEAGDAWPNSDAAFERAAKALVAVMPVRDADILTPKSIEEVIDVVCDSSLLCAGVAVSREAIRNHIAPICTRLEPTLFLGRTLLRTNILEEILGKSFSKELRAHAFQDCWRPESVSNDVPGVDRTTAFLQELLDTRAQLLGVRENIATCNLHRAAELCGRSLVVVTPNTVHSNFQQQRRCILQRLTHDAVCTAITNNCALTHIGLIFDGAAKRYGDSESNRHRITRAAPDHCLSLVDAVDMYTASNIQKAVYVDVSAPVGLTERSHSCFGLLLCHFPGAAMVNAQWCIDHCRPVGPDK